MQFSFRLIQWYDVNAVWTWHYEGIYALYNGASAILQPYVEQQTLYQWLGYVCFAVEDEQRFLVGFFVFRKRAWRRVEVGLAMRPDLTGRGYGLAFVQAGLAFAKQHYAARRFLLKVACFNQRAITVYTRAGFHPIKTVMVDTWQGPVLSYAMERDAWHFIRQREKGCERYGGGSTTTAAGAQGERGQRAYRRIGRRLHPAVHRGADAAGGKPGCRTGRGVCPTLGKDAKPA